MESVAVVAGISTIFKSYKNLYRSFSRISVFRQHYGIFRAIILYFFACDAWRIEAELLLSDDDRDAEAFRRTQENECGMTAIVGSILAQMNVTVLQIDISHPTPWFVGFFWIPSFVSSLIAVWYSSKQLKTIGRLLQPEQIRSWIRSRGESQKLCPASGKQFLPAFTSVLLIASPGLMLCSAINGFVVGVGVRFGLGAFGSTAESNADGWRNSFIVYMTAVVMSYLVYVQVGLVHATEGGDRALEEVFCALRARTDANTDTEAHTFSDSHSRSNTIAADIFPAGAGGGDVVEELQPSSELALREAVRQCQACAGALQQLAEQFDAALLKKDQGPFTAAADDAT